MLRECKISYPYLKTITVAGGGGGEWCFSSRMRSTQSVILFGNRVTAGVSIKSHWVKVGPVSSDCVPERGRHTETHTGKKAV